MGPSVFFKAKANFYSKDMFLQNLWEGFSRKAISVLLLNLNGSK
jgi:hypothetical protein